MVKRALLLLSLAASACGVPVPEGVPLANHMPASTFILQHYQATLAVPLVWGVPSDCQVDEAPGFVNPETGKCVGGMRVGSEIWLVLAPGQHYSSRLCHEIAHYVWEDHDHQRAEIWAQPAGIEWSCAATLAERADLDDMVLR